MSVHFYPPRGIGYRPKTECEINGEHWGDLRANGYWKCCDELDEDAVTCDGCGATSSDADGWDIDGNDRYCPGCAEEDES